MNEGATFAGGIEMSGGSLDVAPDAPLIRVRGSVYFGGVQITVKEAGEDISLAARRRQSRGPSRLTLH
jgi:hypothetical protein